MRFRNLFYEKIKLIRYRPQTSLNYLLIFIQNLPFFSFTHRRLSPYLTSYCIENDVHSGNLAYVLCYNYDEFSITSEYALPTPSSTISIARAISF